MNTRCLAVPLFVYGTVAVAKPDLLWNLTELGSGRISFRSEAWEAAAAISGYLCLVLAIFCLIF